MSVPSAPLTIGDLARRTAVPTTTLRSWESRYGFPRAERARDAGHRRYPESEVRAVLDVLDLRRSGLALHTAVQRVTEAPVRSSSVFAEIRWRHPALAPQVLSRPTLVAMSRAVEDECCARAVEPVLFGGFQRETFLRGSYRRWRELARTARSAVVFADFASPAPVEPGLPIEVALPRDAQLNREWLVICDSPDLPAFLTAVERPGQDAARPDDRVFEALWSVDPRVVRDAGRVAAVLADRYRPGWREDVDDVVPAGDPEPGSPDLHRASALFDRMLGYLDAAR
ncbi:MerR family transcriptional regulator [Nocardioides KLBMP 9356]|uniref:MerR family transcriptional regulator n=1 Tax=Nocardioides potassii TaxID=2911371 RepID=A0ABS9HAC5_9ACTN|nr:DICT sensory domain-containing protein [Nocardioides potassii]MCF6377399.1 MerR family transcriptional regulator [Nocardioides potassii]